LGTQSAYSLGALVRHFYGRILRFLKKTRHVLIYAGRRFQCPVCDNRSRNFVSLRRIASGMLVRPVLIDGTIVGPENYEFLNIENFACSFCLAPDKARLIAQFMATEGFNRLTKLDLPLLHFEPESGLYPYFSRHVDHYLPSSWPEENYPDSFDITDLSLLEGKIGGFICSHILEHVQADSVAAEQLFQALAPGGFGIVLVPIIRSLEENWEVEGELSEEERWKFFGQGDHVRLYSKAGLREVLEGAGFEIRELGIDFFGAGVFETLSITESSRLYICERGDGQ